METRAGARCLLTAACIFLLASCANLAPAAQLSAPAAAGASSCPSDPCKMMAGMCGGRECISTTNCGFRCADVTAGANAAVISEKHFQINPVESLDVSLFGDPPPVEEVALPGTPAGSNSSGTASPARGGATVGATAATSTGHSSATRSPADQVARTTAAGRGVAATTPAQGGDSAGRMPEVNARGPTSVSPRSSTTVASVTGSGGASLSSGTGSKATAGDSALTDSSGSLVSSLVRRTSDGSSQTYTEIAPTAHVSTLGTPSSGVGPATEGSKSIPPGPKADPDPSSNPGGQGHPSKTTASASVLATPAAPAGPNTPAAGAGRKELGLADITSRLIDIIDKIQEIYNRSSDSAAAAPEVRSPRRRDSGLTPAPDAPAQTGASGTPGSQAGASSEVQRSVLGGDVNSKNRNNGSSTGEQLASVTAAPLNMSTIAAQSATNRTSPTEASTEGTTEAHFPSLLDTFQTLTKGSASLNQPLTRIFSRVHHADEGFRIVFP